MTVTSPTTALPETSTTTAIPYSTFPLGRRKGFPVGQSTLERDVLPKVFKPGRYLGMEQGAYNKPFSQATVSLAFAFPDLYEIGISNYGIKLMYSVVNQHPRFLCDRVYALAPDARDVFMAAKIPLYGLESKVPLADFDVLAFSLQYELNYTTILGVLDTAGIPLRSADRQEHDPHTGAPRWPLLIAGGPGSGNPMPLAPFFDAFIIGDGEEILIELMEAIEALKRQPKLTKTDWLARLAEIEGIYIPGVTLKAYKRIVDIAETQIDIAPLIPAVAAIHDRVVVEARRGCDRMCRFCQPCFINLPVREQSIENIKKNALAELEKTGYEECSLLSLSIADYSHFKHLILDVAEVLKDHNASLSLSSQRADRFSLEVAEAVQSVRKSTLTFAPEAGTMRMRDVVNKNLTDEEIVNAVTSAYKAGWNKVKLYFMIGLPTETNADLDGIVELVKMLQEACREIQRNPLLSLKHKLAINLTLSNFVPKPHTPFQWFPQDSMDMIREKVAYLKNAFKGVPGVKLNFTDPEISKLEGVISKGGPELADALELAYRKGAYLDAWDDMLNFQKWFDALTELGIDYEAYTRERLISLDDPLPWDPIDMGLTKSWLKAEYTKATQAASTTPCFEACSTCGVCATYTTWPKFIETPPKILKVTRAPEPIKTAAEHKKAHTTPSTSLPAVMKARVKIEKQGNMRFISHLDWLRYIHRAVIRAQWPLAFSHGFNPHPKMSFGPALAMFEEGLGEYIDIELTAHPQGQEQALLDRLNAILPEGGKALALDWLPIGAPSIEKSLQKAQYTLRWTCKNDLEPATIQDALVSSVARIRAAMQAQQPIIVTASAKVKGKRQPKPFDIAPYLAAVALDTKAQTVQVTLQYQPLFLPSHAQSHAAPCLTQKDAENTTDDPVTQTFNPFPVSTESDDSSSHSQSHPSQKGQLLLSPVVEQAHASHDVSPECLTESPSVTHHTDAVTVLNGSSADRPEDSDASPETTPLLRDKAAPPVSLKVAWLLPLLSEALPDEALHWHSCRTSFSLS